MIDPHLLYVRLTLPRDTPMPIIAAINDCKRFVYVCAQFIESDYTRWELALCLELAQAWQDGLIRRQKVACGIGESNHGINT